MIMNWDYIAGFLDGEGNVMVYNRKDKKGWKFRSVRIAIYQHKKRIFVLEVIQRFLLSKDIDSVIYLSNTMACLRIRGHDSTLAFLRAVHDIVIVKEHDVTRALALIPQLRRFRDWDAVAPEVIQAYQTGQSMYSIGKKYGTQGAVIWQVLKRRGVSSRGNPKFTEYPEPRYK